MRENNRNSIASIGKLPQFTTMNVIDGQAGLVIYSSLIFYSLTIDNILNIIVILILAGVTIVTLTGNNGILTKTQGAIKEKDKGTFKEQLTLYLGEYRIEKEVTSNQDTLKPAVEWMTDQGYIEAKDDYYIFKGTKKAKTDGDVCVIEKENAEAEQNYVLNYYEEANGTAETIMKFSSNGVILTLASNPATPEPPDEEDLPEVTDWEKALPTEYAYVGETDLQEGVWFVDKKYNEWTWVVVPRNEAFTSDKSAYINGSEYNYTKIKEDLVAYVADFRYSDWDDTWYNGCGLEENEYNSLYNAMLASVYKYGGFWISRYEIGQDEYSGAPVSKQDMKPYNDVICSESQNLAEELKIGDKNSSLMFGLQWDLTCKYLENTDYGDGYDTRNDSTSWGNYYNSSFYYNYYGTVMISSDYGYSWHYISDESGSDPYYKEEYTCRLLTTGASDTNKAKNIYDFAGNEWEWTLEKSSSSNGPCVDRGGSYDFDGNYFPAVSRISWDTGDDNGMSFRATLY